MTEQRREQRLLCSELVTVSWHDVNGRVQSATAVLEDISPKGACFQVEGPIPPSEIVDVHYSAGDWQGQVRYCRYDQTGFFVGVEFGPEFEWQSAGYEPDHLLDPRAVQPPKPKVQ